MGRCMPRAAVNDAVFRLYGRQAASVDAADETKRCLVATPALTSIPTSNTFWLIHDGDDTWTFATLLFFRFQRAGPCICLDLLAPTLCPRLLVAYSSLLGLACEHSPTKTTITTTHFK